MRVFIDRHPWCRRIGIILCALASDLSLAKIVSLLSDDAVWWGGIYFGYNLTSVVFMVLTAFLLNRYVLRAEEKRHRAAAVWGGVLLAAAVVYGAYAHYVNDIFISPGETVLQVGLVAALSFFTVPLSEELFLTLGRANRWYALREQAEKERAVKKRPLLYFFVVWAINFVVFIPVFLAWWPGNFWFDAQYQMQNVLTNSYSLHHPLPHTLMMGAAYKLGEAVGNVSWGFQFYTLLQMLILSASFAYFSLYLYRKNAPRCLRAGVVLWFALFPLHAIMSISATKDVLEGAFFLFFMVFMLRLFYDRETFSARSYAGMIISGALTALFRNNAVLAIAFAAFILFLVKKGKTAKIQVCAVFGAIGVMFGVVNGGLSMAVNAYTVDTLRETLSVPIQGLARVASYRRGDLEEPLYQEICRFLRPEDIPKYNPYLSDLVKNMADEAALRSNLFDFVKLWVRVGLQFPDEYLESIITNTLGYWYPLNQGVYVSGDIRLGHFNIGIGEELVKENYCDWAYNLYVPMFTIPNYWYVPILGFFFRIAPYVWLLIYFIMWMFYKKNRRGLVLALLPASYLLTCFLGPMAAMRYIYGIVVCAPVFVYVALIQKDG